MVDATRSPAPEARAGRSGARRGGSREAASAQSEAAPTRQIAHPDARDRGIDHLGLVQVSLEQDVLADRARLQARERDRPAQAGDHSGTLAGELRGDEDEELVDEILLEERRGERGAAFEQERLDAVRRERFELLAQRARAKLELGPLGKRTAAEGDPAGLG